MIEREQPDLIALQEVRLPCKKGADKDRRRAMYQGKRESEIDEYRLVSNTLLQTPGYEVLFSLADIKKAGTAIMLKTALKAQVKSVRFSLPHAAAATVTAGAAGATGAAGAPAQQEEENEEGRIILMEFKDGFTVLNTYVPNHGCTSSSFARRAAWDAHMLSFLRSLPPPLPLVWLGDMNVSHLDHHVSHPKVFTDQKSMRGDANPPPDHKGQPGWSDIERRRFGELLREGKLIDTYRLLRPEPNQEEDFTWRGCEGKDGGYARYYKKGMRIDYLLVRRAMLEGGGREGGRHRVVRATHLGKGIYRNGFLGSDHCPILLELGVVGREGGKEGGKEEVEVVLDGGGGGKAGGGEDGSSDGGGGAEVVVA